MTTKHNFLLFFLYYFVIFCSGDVLAQWYHPADLTDNISPDGISTGFSKVTISDNGVTGITWRQSDGWNNNVLLSEYRNGTWDHPFNSDDIVNPSGDGLQAGYPNISIDSIGNSIIVWHQNDGSSNQIFKSEYRNGTWVHPSGIADNISPDGENAIYPQVAMSDNGDAIIVWWQYLIMTGEKKKIVVSEYRNGAWVNPATIINTTTNYNIATASNGRDLSVAMDNNGNSIIAWVQSDGSQYQIFKSEYRNGTWTHPTDLNDNISPDRTGAGYPL